MNREHMQQWRQNQINAQIGDDRPVRPIHASTRIGSVSADARNHRSCQKVGISPSSGGTFDQGARGAKRITHRQGRTPTSWQGLRAEAGCRRKLRHRNGGESAGMDLAQFRADGGTGRHRPEAAQPGGCRTLWGTRKGDLEPQPHHLRAERRWRDRIARARPTCNGKGRATCGMRSRLVHVAPGASRATVSLEEEWRSRVQES
jgi:hypothetical protein